MKSFCNMKEKIKKLAVSVLGYSIIAGIILFVIAVIAVVSGSVMRIFGFEYESVGSIILFFVVVMVAGNPVICASAGSCVIWMEYGKAGHCFLCNIGYAVFCSCNGFCRLFYGQCICK